MQVEANRLSMTKVQDTATLLAPTTIDETALSRDTCSPQRKQIKYLKLFKFQYNLYKYLESSLCAL